MSTTLSHSCVVDTTSLSPLDQYYHFQEADDETLIAGLKELNELAFEELIRRYSDRLCRYAAYEMSRPVEAPEEIVNEAFLKIWQGAKRRALGHIETGYHLLALLRKSIRYLIITAVRKTKSQKRGPNFKRVDFDLVLELVPDCSFEAVESTAFDGLIVSIQTQLNEISDRRLGDIFVMRMQGRKLTAIAHSLEIGAMTVCDRLKVAKAWLIENGPSLAPA